MTGVSKSKKSSFSVSLRRREKPVPSASQASATRGQAQLAVLLSIVNPKVSDSVQCEEIGMTDALGFNMLEEPQKYPCDWVYSCLYFVLPSSSFVSVLCL